ncbi:hypothetical protein [Microbulbifer sp. ZKSA002]|uniref:hypothetical protein n=1 Tax=Microbulbifer sp. ZKSA002 TaxID=3243388 RepID=UPI00403A6CA6
MPTTPEIIRTTPEIMADHAIENNCDHRPYNQRTALGLERLDRGICFGLAVCWLKAAKDGTRDTFFEGITSQQTDIYEESHSYWQNQKNLRFWQEPTGLHQSTDKVVNNTFRAPKEGDDWKGKDMEALTSWFSAAIGTRYFLLHTPHHTMAAIGSKCGSLRFFDPNGGVVSSRCCKSLANCMRDYFNDPAIKPHYKTTYGYIEITVDKYKI